MEIKDKNGIKFTEKILEKLHSVQLEMLKDLDKFCEGNGIRYCLSSGTLLGAVKYKGFIPWDDDVDISMPRKDFEKFLSLKDKLPDKYHCEATRFNSQFPLTVAKLEKRGTVLKEPCMAHLDVNHGVWIDIFPLDRVMDVSKLPKRAHKQGILKTAITHKLKSFSPPSFSTRIALDILGLFGVKRLDKWRTAVLCSEEESGGTKLTSFASGLGFMKLLFDESVYFPLQKIPFEDTELCVPNDYDAWLKSAFGDYMAPYPKEKQVNKHPIVEIKL